MPSIVAWISDSVNVEPRHSASVCSNTNWNRYEQEKSDKKLCCICGHCDILN
jgi:hypothetical protein